MFQLQRRAFERLDEGVWVDLESEIPVTRGGEMFGELYSGSHYLKEKKSLGSFETGESSGGRGRGKVVRGEEIEMDEEMKWRGFRVSVGRVDTSDTLIDRGSQCDELGMDNREGKS